MFSSPSLTSAPGIRPSAVSLGFVFLCLLLFAPGIHAQDVVSVSGSRSPVTQQPSLAEELSIQDKAARGQAPLSRLYEYIAVKTETIHRLPALPPSEREAGGLEKKLRIGAVRAFPQPLKASSDSSLYIVPEGAVRVMGAVSEGALSVRVRFTNMALPPGARLFVYSMKNRDEVYGPYEGNGPTGDGTFWTPPIDGDAVVIELFTPNLNDGSEESYFQISEVSHIFANPFAPESGEAGEKDSAGFCNLNVTSAYANPAKAVGHLQFTKPGGEYICTGSLLNTQTSDFTPYLITANHCFSTQSASQSLRVYWNYNSGDFPPSGTPFTDGSNLLATGTASDYTFVRLTGSVPGGLWYNGWTTAMPTANTAITGIHHPSGSYKRISFGTVSSISGCPSNIPGPCANFIRVNWQSGVTEGGSSGSELLVGSASDPRYVGNLWGGGSSCSTPSEPDWYGGFATTYPNISSYLAGTPVNRTLTVASSNPASGVVITVSPTDRNGFGNGTTQFTRTYNNNAVVNLTAPATAGVNNFQKWQRDGVDWTTARSTSVTMNANHTMTAVYVSPTTVQVTVQTSPAGRSFTVDGTTYTSARTFSWTPGSSHSIGTTSPQSGGVGVQYVWSKWSDNGAINHNVAPSVNTAYTASFNTITAPAVATTAATSIGISSATLNGVVNPKGAATNCWFEWGTSSTLATFNQTPLQAIGAGNANVAVSRSLSLLNSNTTYYYRVVGSNSLGTSRGAILSFHTTVITSTAENVVWTNAAGVAISGNNLTKTATTLWGNAGASSTRAIASGNGYVEFRANSTDTYRMCGLSKSDSDWNFGDIDFALYVASGGKVYIYEKGVLKGSFGSYVAGDVFRVGVESGVVRYRKNGTLLYTSTLAPSYPLLVDTSLQSTGATINNTVISGTLTTGSVATLENVVWTNAAGVSVSGNTLTKTAPTLWGNAGAISTQAIAFGNGYVEFTANATNTYRMCGLSKGDTDRNFSDIDFALYASSGGKIYIYEKGVLKGSFGSYVAGDVFRVGVESGVVRYRKNGLLLYSSSVPPAYPLLVDTSLYSLGATISNAKIQGSLFH